MKRLLELFNGGVSMTEPLRDKLIRCGWATNFNADTLVRLIERHYASLDAQPEPVGPTDEELLALATIELCYQGIYELQKGEEYQADAAELVNFARAVLARWGRPAAKPVNDRAKPTKTDLTNLMHDFVLGGESAEDFSFDHIGYAHAVLALWGQQ